MTNQPGTTSSAPAQAGIAGGGLLGTGIAIQLLRHGAAVTIVDADPAARTRIERQVHAVCAELADWGRAGPHEAQRLLSRLSVTQDLDALGQMPWVIEAVPEILQAKLDLYRELSPRLAGHCILSSNTSGIVPALLEPAIADPSRFLITHYWNAPHAVPLVEVVPGTRTDPGVLEQAQAWVRATGNEPVLLRKAVPGFVGNRIQYAVLREALSLVEQGVATPEAVDEVVRATLGKRYPWAGPFQIADLGGLQTFAQVSGHLFPELAGGTAGLAVLQERVAAGKLGAASGEGFYKWDDARRKAVAQARKRVLS
ncbi:3-hydroxyacyl-CoA dehydrogenase family protein [Orrella sp. JC864]|uniref:3-hydroxyacyl-CoA dehydrogenase family protein n=1 Tax=Orrella sp. JC864 TaxID=3120298 RepID=UPI00300BCE47